MEAIRTRGHIEMIKGSALGARALPRPFLLPSKAD